MYNLSEEGPYDQKVEKTISLVTRPEHIKNLFPTSVDHDKFWAIWKDVVFDICKRDKELEAIDHQLLEFGRYGYLDDMIEGTEKLISRIKELEAEGGRVDTVFFLDKSGRNGSALFQEMWNILKEQETLIGNMPEIRYVDIGRDGKEKFSSPSSLESLSQKFSHSSLEGKNILVVDEMMVNAIDGSMVKAIETIRKVFRPKTIHGHIQFSNPPVWKGHDNYTPYVLGVANTPNSSEYQQVKYELSKLKHEEIARAVSGGDEDIDRLAVSCNLNNVDGYRSLIKQYLHTAGGFLTIPLKSEYERSMARGYWLTLKTLVRKYMEQASKINS